jgi:hypothetical protein
MTTLHSRKSIGGSLLRHGFLLIPLVLIYLGLSPAARAVLPPPDGGYPGFNTAEGDDALFSLTTGVTNTAIGFEALFSNTMGSANTAIGLQALFSNTTGDANTATGQVALFSNTFGGGNTATGSAALFRNTFGSLNTATGVQALVSNTTGSNNTANGFGALFSNTNGSNNTATGFEALSSATTADGNTATGAGALFSDNTGQNNTANGQNALFRNATGSFNTANGFRALLNTTGSRNIALGFNAGANLTTGDSNIDIGNPGGASDAGTIRIGVQGTQTRTFVAGISGSPITGTGVVVNINGRLGTVASSQRFKDDIKPMDKASEAIHALKPVTFRYKQELDPAGTPQFGLVAEEVEKVNSDLVARDAKGKVYTVRYEAVNAMLLNEFLKEHGKVEKLETTVARQQKQIEALTAGLQKVSAQLEASKPAPQVVNNP